MEDVRVWGAAINDIRARVALWDLFYEADHGRLGAIYNVFHDRCVREGHTFPRQGFVFRNKIRAIVDKRAEAIPVWFTIEAPDEPKLVDFLNEWAAEPNCEGGRTLWAALPEWNRYLERHGNLVLRVAADGDRVVVHRVPVTAADVMLDSRDISRVICWKFTWRVEGLNERGEQSAHTIEEWVDETTYRRIEDGRVEEESLHGAGLIPVVHVAVNRREGEFWGTSIIEHLIEPQLWAAAVMSTIRECHRWVGWPAFAGSLPAASVDIQPGGYTVDETGSLRALTWNINTESIFRELEEYLADMYEMGRVARKSPDALSATGNLPSGKALLILTQDGVTYIQQVCSILEEAMSDLLWKVAVLAGRWTAAQGNPVRVRYPPIRMEDENVKATRARLVLEAYKLGLLPKQEVVRALMDLDVINPAASAEEIVEAAELEVAGILRRIGEGGGQVAE